MFHTSDGQTSKIASRIASRLHELGVGSDLFPVAVAPAPTGHGGVVVADAVRYGRQSRDVWRYVREHTEALTAVPSAFVQVSLAAHGPEVAADRELRRTADRVTSDLGWRPDLVVQVAGALNWSCYGWLTRRLLRRALRVNAPDLPSTGDHEFTDWTAIDAFTDELAARVARS